MLKLNIQSARKILSSFAFGNIGKSGFDQKTFTTTFQLTNKLDRQK